MQRRRRRLGVNFTADVLAAALGRSHHQRSGRRVCDGQEANGVFLGSRSTTPAQRSAESVEGAYPLVVNEILRSPSDEYEVLDVVGKGAFGQVAKCWKNSTNELVAVKILKNHPSYTFQAETEASIVRRLSHENDQVFNFVRLFDYFMHGGHRCLVFELLEQNLHEFLRQRDFAPLPLSCVRPIFQQLLTALRRLKEIGIVHTDLKPENIMFVDQARLPFRVKLVDFGSSMYAEDASAFENEAIQTIFYRAPEIILGLPFNEAIDMWSLGCIIAELFLGFPLYPGYSEYDLIRYMRDTQGIPSSHTLNVAPKTRCFFTEEEDFLGFYWRIKTPEEYENESRETRTRIFSCLDEIADVNPCTDPAAGERACERLDRVQLVDVIKAMLAMEHKQRITPAEALQHPFVQLAHLSYTQSKYFQNAAQLMEACYRR